MQACNAYGWDDPDNPPEMGNEEILADNQVEEEIIVPPPEQKNEINEESLAQPEESDDRPGIHAPTQWANRLRRQLDKTKIYRE